MSEESLGSLDTCHHLDASQILTTTPCVRENKLNSHVEGVTSKKRKCLIWVLSQAHPFWTFDGLEVVDLHGQAP